MTNKTYSLHEKINGQLSAFLETDESYDYFTEGYKHSIDSLFISIENNRSSKFYLDSVLYPLMMQVHYWLETSFKSLYWESQKTLYELQELELDILVNSKGEKSYNIHEFGHELPKLLRLLTEKLKEIDRDWYNQLSFDQLTMFTNELYKITKDGSAWRYLHPIKPKNGIFKEAEFNFDSLSYNVIERIWENIQEEVKELKLLATNRPMNINPTNRTKDFYKRKIEREEKQRLKLT